jgi:hypothetical protein
LTHEAARCIDELRRAPRWLRLTIETQCPSSTSKTWVLGLQPTVQDEDQVVVELGLERQELIVGVIPLTNLRHDQDDLVGPALRDQVDLVNGANHRRLAHRGILPRRAAALTPHEGRSADPSARCQFVEQRLRTAASLVADCACWGRTRR